MWLESEALDILHQFTNDEVDEYGVGDAVDSVFDDSLRQYINEEMFALADAEVPDAYQLGGISGRVVTASRGGGKYASSPSHAMEGTAANTSVSSNFDFNSWMADTETTSEDLLVPQGNLSDIFELPFDTPTTGAVSDPSVREESQARKRPCTQLRRSQREGNKVVSVEKRSVRSTSKYRGV